MKLENLKMHQNEVRSMNEQNKYAVEEVKEKSRNETTEYITEKEAKTVKEMFKRYLKSYKEKDPSMTDKEWLEWLFKTELPETTAKEATADAKEIVESIHTFYDNLESINEAAKYHQKPVIYGHTLEQTFLPILLVFYQPTSSLSKCLVLQPH